MNKNTHHLINYIWKFMILFILHIVIVIMEIYDVHDIMVVMVFPYDMMDKLGSLL